MSSSRPSALAQHRRRRRRRLAAAASKATAIFVAAFVVLALAAGLALYRYANGRIERLDLSEVGQQPSDVTLAMEPIEGLVTILVAGTDSRDGLTPEELEQLGTEAIEDNNTDTLLLLQLSPEREAVAMVSFPRDLQVDVPGMGPRRINRVHDLGGPDLLVATIRELTGVRVDHYVEVDLAGFISVTEALGGVEVCLEEAMTDVYAGVDLPAGCQVLDGYRASGFVRSRRVRDEFGPDSDYGRINRQHYFVRQAMSKVTSLGTLLNPLKVKSLLDAVDGAIRTDSDLDPRLMLRLANTLKTVGTGDIEQRVVPSFYSNETGFGHVIEDEAALLFTALREGRPLPDVGLTGPLELVPDDVRVEVLNGQRVEGLASRVADLLAAEGFVVQGVGNTAEPVEATRILHREGDRPRAELVARFLPGELVVVEDLPVEVDVRVAVGPDTDDPAPPPVPGDADDTTSADDA